MTTLCERLLEELGRLLEEEEAELKEPGEAEEQQR